MNKAELINSVAAAADVSKKEAEAVVSATFDAITAALRELGLEPGSLSAILITHTHADHISGLQTLLKRCDAPVLATERAGRELAWRLPAVEARLETLDFGGSRSVFR